MNKARGDLAESIFQTEALRRGLVPHFPFGDYLPHDIVLFNPKTEKFYRVQVKSTETNRPGRAGGLHFSSCKGSKTKTSYTGKEVDIMALFCFETSEWFIIPLEVVLTKKTISIGPKNTLRKYLDDWSQFSK